MGKAMQVAQEKVDAKAENQRVKDQFMRPRLRFAG